MVIFCVLVFIKFYSSLFWKTTELNLINMTNWTQLDKHGPWKEALREFFVWQCLLNCVTFLCSGKPLNRTQSKLTNTDLQRKHYGSFSCACVFYYIVILFSVLRNHWIELNQNLINTDLKTKHIFFVCPCLTNLCSLLCSGKPLNLTLSESTNTDLLWLSQAGTNTWKHSPHPYMCIHVT